ELADQPATTQERPEQVNLVQLTHHHEVLVRHRCRPVVEAGAVELEQLALPLDAQLLLLVDHRSSLLAAQRLSALDKKSRSMVSSPIFAKSSLASSSPSRLRSALDVNRSEAPSSNCRFQAPI